MATSAIDRNETVPTQTSSASSQAVKSLARAPNRSRAVAASKRRRDTPVGTHICPWGTVPSHSAPPTIIEHSFDLLLPKLLRHPRPSTSVSADCCLSLPQVCCTVPVVLCRSCPPLRSRFQKTTTRSTFLHGRRTHECWAYNGKWLVASSVTASCAATGTRRRHSTDEQRVPSVAPFHFLYR